MSYRGHHYTRGGQVAACLNAAGGYRGDLERRGIKPVDHQRANRAALKELQARNREQRLEEAAVKDSRPWRLKEFSHVKSRYSQDALSEAAASPGAASPRSPAAGDEKARSFLRKGSGAERQARRTRNLRDEVQSGERPRSARKPAVPTRRETMQLMPRERRDYVAGNRASAAELRPPAARSPPPRTVHAEYGQVPGYLQERQRQWKEEEDRRVREMPDPSCPPGMKLMADAERRETLGDLQESQRQLHAMLMRIPLSATTPSVLKKKGMLETKLKQVEDAIHIFSRDKVFVQG